MAVAGNAFPPPHQTEAALGVQAAAGLVVLQYGGLQGPVARRIGSVAQSREQVEADAPAPELLAHIDAHFHHAPVAPAGVYPVQGGPTGYHAVVQHHQTAVLGVGGVPCGIRWAGGLERGVFRGDPL